jgi:phospholipid/cholesterol/gamma-HCH transport system substrate-binding protein
MMTSQAGRARIPVRAAACALAVVVASGCSLQTAGAPRGDMTVTALFNDVQSLVVGHSVQISDVRVGTVTRIGLSGYRAKVTMSLRDDRRVPTGTTATIAKSSLLGENYVQLNPPPGRGLDAGPFLASGAVITQTSVQPDLEQISEKAGPLLAALSGQDISTITGETATALNGKGPKLNTLIKRAADVTDSYAAASDDLGRLLDSFARLGDSLEKGRGQIDKLPGNVALATQRLQDERGKLKLTIQELRKLARSVNAKVRLRHAGRLAVLLDRAQALLTAALRGREELKTVASAVLTFLRSPSVSYSGQGLLFGWLKGFLPATGAAPSGGRSAPAGDRQGTSWSGLLGPRS